MAKEPSPEGMDRGLPVGVKSGLERTAAPSNRRALSASERLATAGSSSCRTHP
jgi:hypothetical protein